MKSLVPSFLVRPLRVALACLATAMLPGPAAASDAPAAAAALDAYLALWDRAAPRFDATRLSEELVLRYRHLDPPLDAEISGRASVLTQMRTLARTGPAWQFRERRVFPTLRPDVYFAQFVATADPGGGAISEQTVVVALELQDRTLVRVVEYANPAVGFASRPPRAPD
jgi:hypothetical protein